MSYDSGGRQDWIQEVLDCQFIFYLFGKKIVFA